LLSRINFGTLHLETPERLLMHHTPPVASSGDEITAAHQKSHLLAENKTKSLMLQCTEFCSRAENNNCNDNHNDNDDNGDDNSS
jgi:hypothetical protein